MTKKIKFPVLCLLHSISSNILSDRVSYISETINVDHCKNSTKFFLFFMEDVPVCDLLPAYYQNRKLEERIDEYELRSTADLRNMTLTDDDMEIVAEQAIIKKQCKRLYLQDNNITSRGASIIAAALKNNRTLEILNLSNNHVFDMGARSLSETLSSNNSILQLLDLCSNDITDLGAQHLTEMLKTNQTLIFLRLSSNKISDQGIQLLANVLARQNNSLQEFYIDHNKLISDLSTDSLVQMLKYNRSLKRFCISHCNLSKKGKKRLRQVVRWKFSLSIQI